MNRQLKEIISRNVSALENSKMDFRALYEITFNNAGFIAEDNDGALVFLARNAWHLNKAQEDFPKIKFAKVKE